MRRWLLLWSADVLVSAARRLEARVEPDFKSCAACERPTSKCIPVCDESCARLVVLTATMPKVTA